jgi:hypothetical protein
MKAMFPRVCLAMIALAMMPRPVVAKVDMVVMEARGIKLEAGQVIDGDAPLTLTDGQQVTLMTEDGTLVKLHGPFAKPPAPAQSAATANVKLALQLLVTQEAGRERAGVIRGGTAQLVPPDPSLVDVSVSGQRCLQADAPITLWRPNSATNQPLQMVPSDRSWRAQADWAAGLDRLSLPSNVPLRRRSNYVVKVGAKEVTLTLIAIPASLTNDAMRARFMMEAGCDGQAKALFAKAGLTAR